MSQATPPVGNIDPALLQQLIDALAAVKASSDQTLPLVQQLSDQLPAPTPPTTPARVEKLEEWKKAEDRVAAFDDLLMKIRTFSLPFIATVVGAGTAYGAKGPPLSVPWWVSVAVSLSFLAVLLLLMWFLFTHRAKAAAEPNVPPATAKDPPVTVTGLVFGWIEWPFLIFLAVCLLFWTIIIGFWQRPDSFLFPAPILCFGSVILFSIYLLDRFYYTGLMLGGVNRIVALEDPSELDFKLATTITETTPKWTYTILVAGYYFVPIFILMNAGLATAAFTAGKA